VGVGAIVDIPFGAKSVQQDVKVGADKIAPVGEQRGVIALVGSGAVGQRGAIGGLSETRRLKG
jgi:hypothetical protein